MTDTSRPRVPAGVREGGRFTAEHRAEPAVSLTATDAQQEVVDRVRRDLADALHARPEDVQVAQTPLHGCGAAAGSVHIVAELQHRQDELIAVGLIAGPAGTTSDLTVSVSWPVHGKAFAVDTSTSAYDPTRGLESTHLAALVEEVRLQAGTQQVVDELLNDPQVAAGRQEVLRTTVIRLGGVTYLEVTDESRRGRGPLRMRLGSEGVAAVQMDTWCGRVTVADRDLDAVLTSLEREYVWALREDPNQKATRHALEARLAEVLGRF